MTYTYYDPETEFEMEVEHSINEDPEIRNPENGNLMKRKITGGAGIFYKGGGWTGAHSLKRDTNYYTDKQKDEIKSGIKEDPYAKWRDEPLR